ncbi:MAG: transglutaminase family protein [Acidimicrobiales bacterium]
MASGRLTELLGRTPIELDRVMAVIASVDDNPPTEDDVVARIDELAAGVDDRTVEGVIRHTFGGLGFIGDASGYYRPRNSYLHLVLERRRGIPLSLAVVATEIGRRVDVALSVVGLPGHVVLGDGPDPTRWFDPFGGGTELDVDGCRQLFARFHPAQMFDPAMLAPLPPAAIALRTLNNLKVAYRRLGLLGPIVRICELSVAVPGAPVSERLELATVLGALGRDEQAARQRRLLVDLDPERADEHRRALRRHRARRN